MAMENPLKRVPPNYGVMVTNTSLPPSHRGGGVVATPSHLYYDGDGGGGSVEMQGGVRSHPSGRTIRKH